MQPSEPSASKQYTTVEVEQIIFEWIIRDYSTTTLLESEFFSGQTGDTVWSMRLKKTRGWLSVTVQRVDSKLRHIAGSISVSLRNDKTDELSHMHAAQFYPNDIGYAENDRMNDSNGSVLFEYDFPHVIRDHLLSTDSDLLHNDQLTIVCEIFAKTQPTLKITHEYTETFSEYIYETNGHSSVEANGNSNEKDVLDRSDMSPDSGIYDAKDRKKRVSFNLSQYADDLKSEYNKLMENVQDAQRDYENGYGDNEYLADAINDNYEDNDSNDDVFISEDVSHETLTLEKQSDENGTSLSPHQPLTVEISDEFFHCKLISSEGEVDAYKTVSPMGADREIFSAMFTKRSDADNGRRARVDETEQAVMIELSRFALSGKVQNMEQYADRLFVAADKYGVDELKERCAEAMCEDVNDENVCTRLILAEEHPSVLASVKTAAINYFKLNLSRVDKFNGYGALLAEHPKLVAEIFFSLAKN